MCFRALGENDSGFEVEFGAYSLSVCWFLFLSFGGWQSSEVRQLFSLSLDPEVAGLRDAFKAKKV